MLWPMYGKGSPCATPLSGWHQALQSPHPTEDEVRREYEQIWPLLLSCKIEDVIDSRKMTDRESIGTLDVLTKVVPPAVFTDRNLRAVIICRAAVNFSRERGQL